MSSEPTLDTQTLLAHSQFVRALARQLVRDENRAEDVVQDTWLAALKRPPRSLRGLRSWLRTTVRNFVSLSARSERRRGQRERVAARPEALPATDALVQRMDLQQRMMAAVLSLDEPHRSVLLHRFFENLPPTKVAERLGLPLETMRSRLNRALELLRHRLKRESASDNRRFMAALVLLAESPASGLAMASARAAASLAPGVALMSVKTKIVITAVLVIAASVASSRLLREVDTTELPKVAGRENPVPEGVVEESLPPAPDPVREVASAVQAPVAEPVPEPVTQAPLEPAHVADVLGIVVDPDGTALPGAEVFLFSAPGGRMVDEPLAQVMTDAEGAFRIEQARFDLRDPKGWVVGMHDSFALGGAFVDANSDAPLTIKLQLPTSLEGAVVDRAGEPVVDADVALRQCGGGGYDGIRVPEGFDRTRVKTNASGHFEFTRLPAGEFVSLQVRRQGYASYHLGVPLSDSELTESVRIVLDAGSEIQGRVFLADTGEPLAGVDVGCQIQSMSASTTNSWAESITDEEGRYRLVGLSAGLWNVFPTLPDEMIGEWTVAAADGVDVDDGQALVDVDFPLVRGALLDIEVLDADTDAGVAGVPIGIYSAARPRSGAAVQRVLSDEDGSILVRVPEGPVRVYVQGFAPGYLHADGAGNLEVENGGEYPVVFSLHPAATVVGRIVDEQGVGLAEALVSRAGRPHGGFVLSPSRVKTRADGTFSLSGFRPGSEMLVRAEKGDLGMPGPIAAETDADGNATVTITLRPNPSDVLRGRVLDPFGKPAAGANLSLIEIRVDGTEVIPEDDWTSSFPVNAEGTFEIDGLWPGNRYRVRATALAPESTSEDRIWWIATSEIFTGAAGDSIQLPDLRLAVKD